MDCSRTACQRLANGANIFSLGDPDQNIRYLSRSSYSGAEKRIANCQYILVIHCTRAILLYYCKVEYVCIYNRVYFYFSINFNQDASLICVSSDHGTVHIFAAEDPKRNKQSRFVFEHTKCFSGNHQLFIIWYLCCVFYCKRCLQSSNPLLPQLGIGQFSPQVFQLQMEFLQVPGPVRFALRLCFWNRTQCCYR